MHKLSAQLTLGLSLKEEATFANYHSIHNEEIVNHLKKTASGQGERIIYLQGTRGEGCTHLLQASCHHAYHNQLTSIYLPLANLLSLSAEILNGLESLSIVCLDDLQVIAGISEWEEAIFHLYNRVFDAGGRIIIAANDLPKSLALSLSDLISRLAFGIVYQLKPLSDEEKLTILMKRAYHRGITLTDEVGRYILSHCPRHMGTLFAALDALDKASLAEKRRLTIPFVKEILQI